MRGKVLKPYTSDKGDKREVGDVVELSGFGCEAVKGGYVEVIDEKPKATKQTARKATAKAATNATAKD